MSLQTVINHATAISIDRRPVVSQTISRAQYVKTAETGQRVWRFRVQPSPGWRWETYRGVMERIDEMDRITEEEVDFKNNTNLSWITQYQGVMTTGQIASITVSSYSGTTFVLTGLPSIASSSVLFKKGDFIQPVNSRYPYSITTDVLRGENATVNVPVNRYIMGDVTINGQGISVGADVSFRVLMFGRPTWSLTPGRIIQWSGDFDLIERVI